MPGKKEIISELHFLSDKLSEQTRVIALSILALVWLFIAGGSDTPSLPSQPSYGLLLLTGLLALLSLLADYLQYVLGYANSKELLDRVEGENLNSAEYNTQAFLYRARSSLFWIKQILAIAALLSLFSAVASGFVCA